VVEQPPARKWVSSKNINHKRTAAGPRNKDRYWESSIDYLKNVCKIDVLHNVFILPIHLLKNVKETTRILSRKNTDLWTNNTYEIGEKGKVK
jgi:hypothetical protein